MPMPKNECICCTSPDVVINLGEAVVLCDVCAKALVDAPMESCGRALKARLPEDSPDVLKNLDIFELGAVVQSKIKEFFDK